MYQYVANGIFFTMFNVTEIAPSCKRNGTNLGSSVSYSRKADKNHIFSVYIVFVRPEKCIDDDSTICQYQHEGNIWNEPTDKPLFNN